MGLVQALGAIGEITVREELKSRLDGLFAEHGEKEQQRRNFKEERIRQEDVFLARFYAVSASVIKPAFEEIGAFATSKGLSSRIDERQDVTAHDGKHTEASVSIHFYLGSDHHRPAHEYPHLSVMCSKYKQKVGLHQSTISPSRGGQGGSIGEFQLEDLSKEFIHDKVADLLQKILV